MLKAGGEIVVQWLHAQDCRPDMNVPMDCQKAVIIPIYKKGSKPQCRDYHIISLLSIPGKVYAGVLEIRIRALSLKKSSGRAGSIPEGMSCVDQLFIVRQVGEKYDRACLKHSIRHIRARENE